MLWQILLASSLNSPPLHDIHNKLYGHFVQVSNSLPGLPDVGYGPGPPLSNSFGGWEGFALLVLLIKARFIGCCEVRNRSTKVGYLMYLGNSNGLLLVLIWPCCEGYSMLLA
jgi:hypothetical protein